MKVAGGFCRRPVLTSPSPSQMQKLVKAAKDGTKDGLERTRAAVKRGRSFIRTKSLIAQGPCLRVFLWGGHADGGAATSCGEDSGWGVAAQAPTALGSTSLLSAWVWISPADPSLPVLQGWRFRPRAPSSRDSLRIIENHWLDIGRAVQGPLSLWILGIGLCIYSTLALLGMVPQGLRS